ncbi:MAG TPA: DUF4344 domain-containing metallopeptidase [Solirubrobacterales bacterium]
MPTDKPDVLSSPGSARLPVLAIALVALLASIAGCGGSSSSSSGSSEAKKAVTATGQINVEWQEPSSAKNRLGYEMLKASETRALAKALAEAFSLPHPLTVKGVNGIGGGPFYQPQDNSITLPYGFAALVVEVLASGNPEASETELGERIGAVNSFILEHEFGHALIADYELPILGKEEDAADAIATALLLKAEGGAGYAAAAAAFWADFSGRQEPPAIADYADQHSLDLQRAFDILCWVAGSSEKSFEEVAELEVLPESRLATCPQEYQQVVTSITKELEPHLKHGVNLAPAE